MRIRKVRVPPWVAIFFLFLIETLSITGQKFSKCLKMAPTVYEKDNCVAGTLLRLHKKLTWLDTKRVMFDCLKEAIALMDEYTIILFTECLVSQLVSSFTKDMKLCRTETVLKLCQLWVQYPLLQSGHFCAKLEIWRSTAVPGNNARLTNFWR